MEEYRTRKHQSAIGLIGFLGGGAAGGFIGNNITNESFTALAQTQNHLSEVTATASALKEVSEIPGASSEVYVFLGEQIVHTEQELQVAKTRLEELPDTNALMAEFLGVALLGSVVGMAVSRGGRSAWDYYWKRRRSAASSSQGADTAANSTANAG